MRKDLKMASKSKQGSNSPVQQVAKMADEPISTNAEKITTKELHNLLIHRIYHEDNLSLMRNYNFITANAFLGAGFAVVVAIKPTEEVKMLAMFGYVIAGLGFLWALLQVMYGKMQATVIDLWRMQAWMAEDALNTQFDRTLFDIYELSEVKTPFGPIKPPYKLGIRDRLPFLLVFKIPFGVIIPWTTAAFWLALTYIMLLNHQHYHLVGKEISNVVLGVMGALLLLSLFCRTLYPQSMLDKYIASRHGQKDQPSRTPHKGS